MAYVFDKVINAEPTVTVATSAYTAGDVVGGLLTFDVHSPSGCGLITSVRITDAANQSEPYTLYLFDSVPSTIADDAAAALTIADLKKCVAMVAIAADDYTTVNSLAIAIVDDLNDAYRAAGTGKLYGYLVAGETPDYSAATDLAVRLTVLTS